MAGGSEHGVSLLQPALETLAPPGGWAHVGPSGAGHFVKMVHNGVEYGLMQAYAEGFELMNASQFDLDFEQISGIWRYGSVVRSWLLELLHDAIAEHGNDLADIAGYVEDSGEGRWTVEEAVDSAVPLPVITAALYARFASRQDESFAAKINAALRAQFGGHAVKKNADDRDSDAATENPLLEGLGPAADSRALRARHLRRVGRPHAAQDLPGPLRARHQAPPARALRHRRRRSLGPERRGVPRPDGTRRARVRPRRLRAGGLGRARRRDALPGHGLRRRVARGRARQAPEQARRGARHARQPRLLPRRPAAGDADHRQGARQAPKDRRLDAAHRREAVRPRPRLGPRAHRADQPALHRGRGVPNRPLPRQGDRPEHAGAPLRERHLRADLEPPVHRSHPDHGRGDARDRGSRRATTSRPARSATSSRTTCSSSSR